MAWTPVRTSCRPEKAAIAGAQTDPPVAEVAARQLLDGQCLEPNQAVCALPGISEVKGALLRSRSES
jgi:hypothetical protein